MFCRIRVPFEPSKVSILGNRGLFFHGKNQWKGVGLYFGERSYVLLLGLSGGTGIKKHIKLLTYLLLALLYLCLLLFDLLCDLFVLIQLGMDGVEGFLILFSVAIGLRILQPRLQLFILLLQENYLFSDKIKFTCQILSNEVKVLYSRMTKTRKDILAT